MSWKVTVRHRSSVDRVKVGTLDQAIAEARGAVDRVRRQGNLPAISALRDFKSKQRVHARIELSGPGLLRGKEGGVDVMGDGSVIAYTGTIRKEPVEADTLDEALERLEDVLG